MSAPETSAVVMGATGAVGGQLLKTLLESSAFTRVTTLGRRPAAVTASAKLEQRVVDVADPATYETLLPGHAAAFCALGVGEPSKMSKEEFRRVDFEVPLKFAEACERQGVSHFTLLGAVGANPRSSYFYLRCKGELEEGIKALGFDRVSFFRPSMILTPTNRYGVSQAILLKVWPIVDKLLMGPLKQFRGIKVEDLGRAMARNALLPKSDPLRGVEILTWKDFKRVSAA